MDANECTRRHDDSGFRNLLKAWYLFFLHLVASILLFIGMTRWIDGYNFQTGSPTSVSRPGTPLYQTQVNGLLSLALVMIRLLASSCTALLVWRMILILLEKEGMTLTELTRLNNYRVPILPRLKSKLQVLWFCWATLIVLFLWPPSFAPPLANSSLAWTPSAQTLGLPNSVSMAAWGDNSSLWMLRAIEWRMQSVMKAFVMTGADPKYAFSATDLPLRRYFHPPIKMSENSTISTTLPYIDIQLQWIDAESDNRSSKIDNSFFTDFVNPGSYALSRLNGSVTVVRNGSWDPINDAPKEAKTLVGQRLVATKVSTYDNGTRLENGSFASWDTPCPPKSPDFGGLPEFQQHKQFFTDNGKFWGADCYQIGVVAIKAGLYSGTDCNVLLAGSTDCSATCSTPRDSNKVTDDWIAPVALEMISEIMKNTVMVNFTQQWMEKNLEGYTTGMLTLACHAAWSSVMNTLAQDSESSTFRRAESMVRASVDRGKLYGWLAMNLSLSVAAVLLYIALSFSSVKTIRDTTLTPLTLDFSLITNSQRANGLCDAVALSKEDCKLPRVKLIDNGKKISEGYNGLSLNGSCRRRVVFVDGSGNKVH